MISASLVAFLGAILFLIGACAGAEPEGPLSKRPSRDPASGRIFFQQLAADGDDFAWIYEPACTASGVELDGKRYILSAAHCFVGTLAGLNSAVHLNVEARDFIFEFTNCGPSDGPQPVVEFDRVYRSLGDAAFPLGAPVLGAIGKYGDVALAEFTKIAGPDPDPSCFARVPEVVPEVVGTDFVIHGIRNFDWEPESATSPEAEDDRMRVFEKRTVVDQVDGWIASVLRPVGAGGDSGGRGHSAEDPTVTLTVNSYGADADDEPRCFGLSLVTAPLLRELLVGAESSDEIEAATLPTGWAGHEVPAAVGCSPELLE